MHDVDDYPPFGLTSKLAELEQTWRNSLWGAEDTAWLNENAPLFDTGIYAFDANRWFSLAAQLFKANMRQDVWVLCCCDMDFAWPSPLNIPVKIKRPGDVLALASSWCYNHADQRVRPFWDSASQSLQALPRTGSFKKEHALTLLEAFSSHELLEQIKKVCWCSKHLDWTTQAIF